VKYVYSAGAMGYYGEGYMWHYLFEFPKFPFVTKTITLHPKNGHPWRIWRWNKSIYNQVALHNPGFQIWKEKFYKPNERAIVSIAGTQEEVDYIVSELDKLEIKGIEINISCPNTKLRKIQIHQIPESRHPIWLKVGSCDYEFDEKIEDLDRIEGIRLNSVWKKSWFRDGWAVSGKGAQFENWWFLKHLIKKGWNVSGCSFTNIDELKYLIKFLGVREIAIGSIMLIKPDLVEKIEKICDEITRELEMEDQLVQRMREQDEEIFGCESI